MTSPLRDKSIKLGGIINKLEDEQCSWRDIHHCCVLAWSTLWLIVVARAAVSVSPQSRVKRHPQTARLHVIQLFTRSHSWALTVAGNEPVNETTAGLTAGAQHFRIYITIKSPRLLWGDTDYVMWKDEVTSAVRSKWHIALQSQPIAKKVLFLINNLLLNTLPIRHHNCFY